jgi:hypothetical protein
MAMGNGCGFASRAYLLLFFSIQFLTVFRIRSIRKFFFGHPELDPLVGGSDPDPSIIKRK